MLTYLHLGNVRNWCAALIIVVMGLAMPTPVSAGEGGGRDPVEPSANAAPANGVSRMSQDALLSMTHGDIRRAQETAEAKGQALQIDGFSKNMTEPLREMFKTDRRSARRLIRDMRNITDERQRRARLDQEIKEQTRRMDAYAASLHALKDKTDATSKAIYAEDDERWKKANLFRTALQFWRYAPREGMR